MANIAAIEKAVMTTADEKMLKQMAESMSYDIYQQLSPEARGRLAGKEVPASSPYTGELPLKKHTAAESTTVTDKDLNNPNNKIWQKQAEKRFEREFSKITNTKISDMTPSEIVEMKNIILAMQDALNRCGALKGLV